MPKQPLDPNLILGTQPTSTQTPQSGGWTPLAAAATRGISGLIGTGGPVGAIASGGGEALAQLIESLGGLGGDQTLGQRIGRIGTEAAIGWVPFGKVAKSGELLHNLLRGGALAGAGEAAREYITDGELNPASIAASSAFGGASAAGAQKLFDVLGGARTPKVPSEVVPTSQTARAPQPRPIKPRGPQGDSQIPVATAPQAPAPAGGLNHADSFDPAEFDRVMGTGTARVPYGGNPVEPSRSFQRTEATAQRSQDAAWAQEARNMNAAEKTQGNIDRLADIEAKRAASGAEAQPPTFSESTSATLPDGSRASMSTRYAQPKPEEGDEIAELLGGQAPRPAPQATPAVAPQAPPQADPEAEIARFFNSRVDAAGTGYREAKAAGDVPKDTVGRVHGRALQREGQEAGLPPRGPIPSATPTPQTAPESSPDWVQQELSVVERLKKLMSDQRGGGFGGGSGEAGFVHPEVASTMASAGLGGLAGYSLGAGREDDDINPIMSGLIGALGGAALPHAPALFRGGMGAARDLIDRGVESFGNLDDAKETLLQTIERIPNVQRFNLLSSPTGLMENAIAGPYGSAVMGSLEKGLAGDSRGWDALSEVGNPIKFFRSMHTRDRADEALDLVRKGELGRAEFGDVTDPNLFDDVTKGPGWYMTMGDRTANEGLAKAGFSDAEARKMTLTSEPDSYMQWLAHFGSNRGDTAKSRLGNVALNTMLPFRRTPANIIEQGVDRLPGVGAAVQFLNKGDANLREIGAQQLLGTGVMGANYVAGDQIEDPTTAREARRTLSNLGGQYSLPASLGFAAGQAHQKGQTGKQFHQQAARELFPVPTTRPIEENLNAVGDLGSMLMGESNPDAKLPSGAKPAFYREWVEREDEPNVLPSLPTFRFRR